MSIYEILIISSSALLVLTLVLYSGMVIGERRKEDRRAQADLDTIERRGQEI